MVKAQESRSIVQLSPIMPRHSPVPQKLLDQLNNKFTVIGYVTVCYDKVYIGIIAQATQIKCSIQICKRQAGTRNRQFALHGLIIYRCVSSTTVLRATDEQAKWNPHPSRPKEQNMLMQLTLACSSNSINNRSIKMWLQNFQSMYDIVSEPPSPSINFTSATVLNMPAGHSNLQQCSRFPYFRDTIVHV